jgi:hypothetical protein
MAAAVAAVAYRVRESFSARPETLPRTVPSRQPLPPADPSDLNVRRTFPPPAFPARARSAGEKLKPRKADLLDPFTADLD